MIITIVLWVVLVALLWGIGWNRLRQGFTDLLGLTSGVATLPLDALWGMRRPLIWSAVITSVATLVFLITGIACGENDHYRVGGVLVAIGGVIFGVFLAFGWYFANVLTAYISKLVGAVEYAATAFVRFLDILLEKLGVAKSQESQPEIKIVDRDKLKKQISSTFGFATAVWFALMVYLMMAPYWDTLLTLPVLTLFALTIAFFGIQWQLGRNSEGKSDNKVPKRIYGMVIWAFYAYLAISIFGIFSARVDAIYNSLPESGQAVARYLAAIRDESATLISHGSLSKETNAKMTMGVITEDAALYRIEKDEDGKVLITRLKQELKQGTKVACLVPKPKTVVVGLEPMVAIALPDPDTNEFVMGEVAGWVAARKFRPEKPITDTNSFADWKPQSLLPALFWLVIFVGALIGLWSSIKTRSFKPLVLAMLLVIFGLLYGGRITAGLASVSFPYVGSQPSFAPVRQPVPTDGLVRAAARKYGVPFELMASLCLQESGCSLNTPDGASGEIGPMQVRPQTAALFGVTADQLRDPATNFDTAARIIQANLQRYEGVPDSLQKVILAYNAPGLAEKYRNTPWTDIPATVLSGINAAGVSYDAYQYVASVVSIINGSIPQRTAVYTASAAPPAPRQPESETVTLVIHNSGERILRLAFTKDDPPASVLLVPDGFRKHLWPKSQEDGQWEVRDGEGNLIRTVSRPTKAYETVDVS